MFFVFVFFFFNYSPNLPLLCGEDVNTGFFFFFFGPICLNNYKKVCWFFYFLGPGCCEVYDRIYA